MLTFLSDLTPASAVCLSVSVYAAASIPVLLLAPADLSAFDPRPLAVRARDRLLVEAVNARYVARDAAVYLAALVMLLSAPVSAPKGATR